VLTLMCRAVSEGFAALRRQCVAGLPRNLALLHRAVLRPLAIRYWARTLRSPLGELCFAAHARHAAAEMQAPQRGGAGAGWPRRRGAAPPPAPGPWARMTSVEPASVRAVGGSCRG